MSLITTIRDLHRRKGRERRGLALAEGVRLVEEMLGAAVPCKGVVVSPALRGTPRGAALVTALGHAAIALEEVSDQELATLAATEHPQGVVAVYQPCAWSLDDLRPRAGHPLVILDAVQDPGNVGTIARTALAFGAAGMIALAGTVDLANPKVVRAAAGALFRLPHLHGEQAEVLEALRRTGVALWATTTDGEPVGVCPEVPVALVLGNEGAGMQPELLAAAARQVTIPIRRDSESLNVAVAAGILLHQLGERGHRMILDVVAASPLAFGLGVGVLGLLVGSFLNVCISRWPSEQSVVRPRSRCPRCGTLIAWYDNIPIGSWLVLRARCRHCREPIPAMYPLVELATGVIWGVAAWHYGPSVELLRAAVFFTLLLGIAMTDAREYIIPDEFSVGGAVLGLGFAFAGGMLPWPQALLGAVAGYLLLWLVAIIGAKMFGQDAMGGGDVKMMAMIGAFLGWQGVLGSLFLGALIGTLIFLPLKLAGREKLVPFGIFLGVGAAAMWLVGDAIVRWYLGMI